MREIAWYGCRRDTKDARDVIFKPRTTRMPSEVDLRSCIPPVMNQGPIGSCTGHGVTGAFRYLRIKAGKSDIPLSRLQNYYDAREIEDCTSSDAGAEIRDNIKAAAKLGIAREELWPYEIHRFAERPPPVVYENALNYQAIEFQRVPVNTAAIKQVLADGFPVVIGVSLYDSFEGLEVERTGVVPMPDLDVEGLAGGHCMLVVGFGQLEGYFTVRNSWGADWGASGDCYMPYSYLGSISYGSDYWVVREAETLDLLSTALKLNL